MTQIESDLEFLAFIQRQLNSQAFVFVDGVAWTRLETLSGHRHYYGQPAPGNLWALDRDNVQIALSQANLKIAAQVAARMLT